MKCKACKTPRPKLWTRWGGFCNNECFDTWMNKELAKTPKVLSSENCGGCFQQYDITRGMYYGVEAWKCSHCGWIPPEMYQEMIKMLDPQSFILGIIAGIIACTLILVFFKMAGES